MNIGQFIKIVKTAREGMCEARDGLAEGSGMETFEVSTLLQQHITSLAISITVFEEFINRCAGDTVDTDPIVMLRNRDCKHTPCERLLIAAAVEAFHEDGRLEIEDPTVVSAGDEPGAYVMAWQWVPYDMIQFPRRFKAHVYYSDSGGARHLIATDSVIAVDTRAAHDKLLDEHWDSRLDSASCSPVLDWVNEGDLHPFQVTISAVDETEQLPLGGVTLTVFQMSFADVRPAMEMVLPPAQYKLSIAGEEMVDDGEK